MGLILDSGCWWLCNVLHSMPAGNAAVFQITWHATSMLSNELPLIRLPQRCSLKAREAALQALICCGCAWLSIR